MRTVGTFIECENQILILHRNIGKSQGNTWGLPAGKVDSGETDLDAAVREIYEETGYNANPQDLILLGVFEYSFPNIHISFPTFKLKIASKFEVKLNPTEHYEYKWVSPNECYRMDNLIHGFQDLLEKTYFKEIKNKKV